MFIDKVTISVKGGRGGDGCISFRREKHVPRGGPDGGDGGCGGDVIVSVDPHMRTLLDLRYRQSYAAGKGRHGRGKRMTGASGAGVVVTVPPGTLVQDASDGSVLADLVGPGQSVVAARGGRGGKGNYAFRSPSDQAPRKRTEGEAGKQRQLVLTLKLIADVGLVGLPNAGKSTLLRAVSDAHPVVAPYPFSTTAPVLGMVRVDEGLSFCMVDIPGLIEGAHRGKGLGTQFLRHIERCRLLLLLLDVAGDVPAEQACEQLLSELRLYSEELVERPRLVALNKIDLLSKGESDSVFAGSSPGSVFRISAEKRIGLRELVYALSSALERLAGEEVGRS